MSATEQTGGESYVLLQIGDRRFAVPAKYVSELAPPVRLHEFPIMFIGIWFTFGVLWVAAIAWGFQWF